MSLLETATQGHGYLDNYANYGGEWTELGTIYAELGDKLAGAWIAGYRRGGGYFLTPEQVNLDMERYGHVAGWR